MLFYTARIALLKGSFTFVSTTNVLAAGLSFTDAISGHDDVTAF